MRRTNPDLRRTLRGCLGDFARLEDDHRALASTSASRRSASTAKPAAKGRRGRRKGAGKRAAQALALIVAEPGITIPALATKMGIKQNYLYRVIPSLEQAGKIRKEGRGRHPKGA